MAATSSCLREGPQATHIGPSGDARHRIRQGTLRYGRRCRGRHMSRSCTRRPSGHRKTPAAADLTRVQFGASSTIGQTALRLLLRHHRHLPDECVYDVTLQTLSHSTGATAGLDGHRAHPRCPNRIASHSDVGHSHLRKRSCTAVTAVFGVKQPRARACNLGANAKHRHHPYG